MKKSILPMLLVFSLGLSACAANSTEEAPIEEKITPVETTALAKSTIERKLIYAGQVKPAEQIMVLPKIGGKVIAVHYDVGDRVNKDDILFEIDDSDLQNSIRQAQAQYSTSLTGVETAQTSLDTVSGPQTETTLLQLESAVKNAELAVSNAKTALDSVTTTYENIKTLYAAGAVSKSEYDRTELSYKQAQAAYDQASLGLSQANEAHQLYLDKTRESSERQAQSGLNQASSAAEAAKVALDNVVSNLKDLKVASPLTGVITSRNVEIGAMSAPSSPAFTVIDMDTVFVNTNVSEELINVIYPGMEVEVFIASIGPEAFVGEIATVSPAAEEMRNTYPVKIKLDNKEGILKPGMFSEVHFIKEISENTYVVPRNAVQDEETTRYVFVEENGICKKYMVQTGIDNGREIEITEGLPEKANIITKGQNNISDGEKVIVVNTKGA